MSEITFRPARPGDAGFLAPLVNAAGEGIPLYNWTRLAEPGEDPWAFGRARIAGTDAAVSHRNGIVGFLDGRPAGCLFSYHQPLMPEPVEAGLPPIIQPLAELEAMVPGTHYVNVLATDPGARRRGVGGALLDFAARTPGPKGMSIIVADANANARRLYAAKGYAEAARRPMVKDGWTGHGAEWLLLVRG